jgi:hypothetical protein
VALAPHVRLPSPNPAPEVTKGPRVGAASGHKIGPDQHAPSHRQTGVVASGATGARRGTYLSPDTDRRTQTVHPLLAMAGGAGPRARARCAFGTGQCGRSAGVAFLGSDAPVGCVYGLSRLTASRGGTGWLPGSRGRSGASVKLSHGAQARVVICSPVAVTGPVSRGTS